MSNNALVKNIISQLLDIQEGETWLDESFKSKLAAVSEENAFVRPIPELHSVAELIAHILVWRRTAVQRIKNKEADINVSNEENWPTNETLKTIGWEKLKKDFYASTQELIALTENKDDSFLNTKYLGKYHYHFLLEGLVHHDLYHLGQIGITIKFLDMLHDNNKKVMLFIP